MNKYFGLIGEDSRDIRIDPHLGQSDLEVSELKRQIITLLKKFCDVAKKYTV